jgi:hypothetical protein
MIDELDACANCGILLCVGRIFVRYHLSMCEKCAQAIDDAKEVLPEPNHGES